MRSKWQIWVGMLLYLGAFNVVFFTLPGYLLRASNGAITSQQATLPVLVAGAMGSLGVVLGVWLGKR